MFWSLVVPNMGCLLGIKPLVPPWKPYDRPRLSRSRHRQGPPFLYSEVISWVRVCFNGFKRFDLQKAVV